MNEESQQFEAPTANATEPGSRCLTIAQAADAIGVDSFTMLSFIQRGKVNPTRSPSGEIMLTESELATLTEKGQ
jgi:predicted site-specific integrase-resolvase